MQLWPKIYKSRGLQSKINSIAATGVFRLIKPMVLKANLWIWFNLSLAHWYTSRFDQQTEAYVNVGRINVLYHNSCVLGRQPFMEDIKFAVLQIVLLAFEDEDVCQEQEIRSFQEINNLQTLFFLCVLTQYQTSFFRLPWIFFIKEMGKGESKSACATKTSKSLS